MLNTKKLKIVNPKHFEHVSSKLQVSDELICVCETGLHFQFKTYS